MFIKVKSHAPRHLEIRQDFRLQLVLHHFRETFRRQDPHTGPPGPVAGQRADHRGIGVRGSDQPCSAALMTVRQAVGAGPHHRFDLSYFRLHPL